MIVEKKTKVNHGNKNALETVTEPTKPNLAISKQRATYLAELFAKTAKAYTGDIELPPEIISNVSKDLRKVRATANELLQLDERPYAVIPHDLATRSHWFMRRFRNSGGWNSL